MSMIMEILMKYEKTKKNKKMWAGLFKVMGGNIPCGNYLGRNFPGENLPGGSLTSGNFPGSFPDTTLYVWVQIKILLLLVICYF